MKEKIKLHLGCGERYISGYVNVDVQKYDTVDVVADIMKLPYEDNTVDLIYSCGMLEHFGINQNLSFFRNTCWIDVLEYWHKLLKPGGELYLSVPDFEAVCYEYLENRDITKLYGFLCSSQDNDEDLHGMCYDFKLLSEGLNSVGYTKIEKYNWKEFEPFVGTDYDDFSAAYLPHMDFENGRQMMLNVKCVKS
ncbi:methyltransferase [archaeon]|nr:methyltransferase [archaeon]|tara:strand:- start:4683 stop:5261 length:579 start_codon:yes stop_codon:yes gene_type:complete